MKTKIERSKSTHDLFLKKVILFFVLLLSLAPKVSWAEETPPEEGEDTSWEETFIYGNIAIAEWFSSMADGLDLFLVGKRVTNRPNRTSFRIENTTVSTESESVTNSTGLSVSLRLPNVEDYWQLKFTTYDEQAESRNIKGEYLRQTPREKNVGATVGLLATIGNVRTTFEPRIELSDPLKISHSLTFESVGKYKKSTVNPELEFYADASDGLGTAQELNFYFKLSDRYSITFVNQGNYLEKTHFYDVNNGVSLGRLITDRMTFSYNFILSSNNQPNYHLESYNASVAFSHILYRRILDYEIVPNVDFQEDDGFHAVLGITFKINLNF